MSGQVIAEITTPLGRPPAAPRAPRPVRTHV